MPAKSSPIPAVMKSASSRFITASESHEAPTEARFTFQPMPVMCAFASRSCERISLSASSWRSQLLTPERSMVTVASAAPAVDEPMPC